MRPAGTPAHDADQGKDRQDRSDQDRDGRGGPEGLVGVWVAGVTAPLAVVKGAETLPLAETPRGAVLVAGWVGLAAAARALERRRARRARTDERRHR